MILPETTVDSRFRFYYGRSAIIDKKKVDSTIESLFARTTRRIFKCYLRRICYLSFQVKLTQDQAQQLKTKELVT